MKVLLPLLNGSLRADRAIEKAKRLGDQITISYALPSRFLSHFSYPKLLFFALCGNYAMNYAQEKLLPKKAKKVFLVGDEESEIASLAKAENCGLLIAEG